MEAGRLVVGVDGGNTKTVALACDLTGRAVGIGRGGSSNWEMLGAPRAAAVITDIVEQALAMAGRQRKDVLCLHMTLAGVDWPDDVPRMETALRESGWECPLGLENDSFAAIRASAPEGHGIGVTAGTGVASAIIRPDGEKYFYGAFTDLGGGIDAAAQGLRAVIRTEDGRGRPTALAPALLEATGYPTVTALVRDLHREERHIPRTILDPVLFATAAKGDPVAVEIVTRFGGELALCATNLIRRYGLTREAPAVIASGSLFMKTGPLLFDLFCREVLAAAPRARMVLSDQPPVMGAVRGALAAASRDAPEVWEELRRRVSQQGWLRADVAGPA
jgi:N-acetylglucosamine kinase-like BadF-type ATPase